MMVECDIGMIWEIKGNVLYIKVILGDSIVSCNFFESDK